MRPFRSLKSLAVGAVVEYLFDPRDGARRRAMVRDQALKAARKTARFAVAARADMRNRGIGLAAVTRGALDDVRRRAMAEQVDDDVLVERVRERLGHVVAHPGKITVRADAGTVTLDGAVFASEREPVVQAVRKVRGVQAVDEMLSDLPGDPDPASARQPPTLSHRMLGHWSPTARVLAGSAGAMMTLRGLRRGGAAAAPTVMAGVGLLARGIARKAEPGAELIGLSGGTLDEDAGDRA